MVRSSQLARSITVNGRFLSQPTTGVQRYAHELLNALDALLVARKVEPLPVTVLAPPNAGTLPAWSVLRARRAGRLKGQAWEQFDLALHARGSLLFTPCGGAPLAHDRHVITIHDAGIFATPLAYAPAYRVYYKILQKQLARKARHIISVSQFSKKELIRYLDIPEEKISCTWLSGEHVLGFPTDNTALERNQLKPGGYILAVGSRNPNKNLHGLAAALAYLQETHLTLAVVGGSNSAIFGRNGGFAGPVRELGMVTDGQLRTLYENAACFIFPSFYEGFGLPPLEALTLGVPVVVSRAASLPEIFGDAVIYCDPNSPKDIADQISYATSVGDRNTESARTHASSFTWERCARQTWDVLLQHCS